MISRVVYGVIGLVIGIVGWSLVGMNISDINTFEFWGVIMVSTGSYLLTAVTFGD